VPQVWNPFLLTVSSNPALERIILSPTEYEPVFCSIPPHSLSGPSSTHASSSRRQGARPSPVLPNLSAETPLKEQTDELGALPEQLPAPLDSSHLYLRTAAKHPRLSALIRAGTYVHIVHIRLSIVDVLLLAISPTMRARSSTLPSIPRARSAIHAPGLARVRSAGVRA
jgi:hypothetical protein